MKRKKMTLAVALRILGDFDGYIYSDLTQAERREFDRAVRFIRNEK